VSKSGIHQPVGGIHGRDNQGAFSIISSGGYEDDIDNRDMRTNPPPWLFEYMCSMHMHYNYYIVIC